MKTNFSVIGLINSIFFATELMKKSDPNVILEARKIMPLHNRNTRIEVKNYQLMN